VTVTGELTGTDTLTEIDGVWFKGAGEWASLDSLASSAASVAEAGTLSFGARAPEPVVLDADGSRMAATERANGPTGLQPAPPPASEPVSPSIAPRDGRAPMEDDRLNLGLDEDFGA